MVVRVVVSAREDEHEEEEEEAVGGGGGLRAGVLLLDASELAGMVHARG
jgi:hypothetical protein